MLVLSGRLAVAMLLAPSAALAGAQPLGLVDFDGAEVGLVGYSNPIINYAGPGLGTSALDVSAFGTSTWAAGDAFWPMTRQAEGPNGVGMPYNISDDSLVASAGARAFPLDMLGFAGVELTNGFFGVTDTVNPQNPNPLSADFTFDIAGATDLAVQLDLIAMGQFEPNDIYAFSYRVDDGPFVPLFTAAVAESELAVYQMDSGLHVALPNPLQVGGLTLTDAYQQLQADLPGVQGSTLTIRLTATADGSEGFGFDNLRILPEPSSAACLLVLTARATRVRGRGTGSGFRC